MTIKTRKTRWYQFSLRTMLAVVTLVCLVGAYVAHRRQLAENAQRTIEAVEQLGGHIGYDVPVLRPSRFGGASSLPPAPSNSIFGDDSYTKARTVSFFGEFSTKTSDDLHLERLPYLEELDLDKTRLSDMGLSRLARSTELRVLSLRDADITDAGLRNLEGLQKLTYLRVDGTSVSNAGMESLAVLHQLKVLYLDRTKVSDQGLIPLTRLSKLREIYLDGSAISDAGLVHLTHLPELRVLSLSNTRVSDEGLKNLSGMIHLERIFLDGTQITNQGLSHLCAIKDLYQVELRNTHVTNEAAREFQEALSRSRIIGDW